MGGETKMSEKDATEEQIQEALNLIITNHPEKPIRLLAKLIHNLRFDLDEFKIEVYKFVKGLGAEELQDIDIKYPDKKIEKNCRRLNDDFYS